MTEIVDEEDEDVETPDELPPPRLPAASASAVNRVKFLKDKFEATVSAASQLPQKIQPPLKVLDDLHSIQSYFFTPYQNPNEAQGSTLSLASTCSTTSTMSFFGGSFFGNRLSGYLTPALRASLSSLPAASASMRPNTWAGKDDSDDLLRDGGDELDEGPTGHKAPSIAVNKKAYYVVKELLDTERVYVDVLKLLCVDFLDYVSANTTAELTTDDIRRIFHYDSLRPIFDFTKECILDPLTERLSHWDDNPRISDILLPKIKFLRMYVPFINHTASIVSEYTTRMHSTPDFPRLIEGFQRQVMKSSPIEHLRLKAKLPFMEMVNEPFRRITRYRLLFPEYAKSVTPDSADYEGAQEMSRQILSIVAHVNERAAEVAESADFFRGMMVLQDKLGNLRYKLNNRVVNKIIREGELPKISRKSQQLRFLVLFDLALFVANPLKTSSGFWVKYDIWLDLPGFSVSIDPTDDTQRNFQVRWTRRPFMFRASTPEERDNWVRDIGEAKERLADAAKSDGEDATVAKPEPWKPDHYFSCCTLCAQKFWLLAKRYHCRICGLVYCATCSDRQLQLQGKVQRVCLICFHVECALMNEASMALPEELDVDKFTFSNMSKETKLKLMRRYYFSTLIPPVERQLKAKPSKTKGVSRGGTASNSPSLQRRMEVPYLREISGSSPESSLSGYQLIFLPESKKFVIKWVVILKSDIAIFDAREDTVAIRRSCISGFQVEGPLSLNKFSSQLQRAAKNVSANFIVRCSPENLEVADHLSEDGKSTDNSSGKQSESFIFAAKASAAIGRLAEKLRLATLPPYE